MKLPGLKTIAASENPKSIASSWVFTIVWCAGTFFAFYTFGIKGRSVGGGLVCGVLALCGLAMLYECVRMSLDYSKFGTVRFALHGEPAIGGRLIATVDLPGKARDAVSVMAELVCMRVTWTRMSGKGLSMGEEEAWKAAQEFQARIGLSGNSAALQFDIPADLPHSDAPRDVPGGSGIIGGGGAGIEVGRVYHRWEVRVTAAVPGLDLQRTFRVKVLPGTKPDFAQRVAQRVLAERQEQTAREPPSRRGG